MELDDKDMKILDMLKEDSSLSTGKISKRTMIPITTVHNRIKKMTSEGIIRSYTIEVDKKKLGKNIFSFILIKVDHNVLKSKGMTQLDLARKLNSIDCVDEVNIVAGATDIIVKISVKDIEELNDFIMNRLAELKGIESTSTMITLDEVE